VQGGFHGGSVGEVVGGRQHRAATGLQLVGQLAPALLGVGGQHGVQAGTRVGARDVQRRCPQVLEGGLRDARHCRAPEEVLGEVGHEGRQQIGAAGAGCAAQPVAPAVQFQARVPDLAQVLTRGCRVRREGGQVCGGVLLAAQFGFQGGQGLVPQVVGVLQDGEGRVHAGLVGEALQQGLTKGVDGADEQARGVLEHFLVDHRGSVQLRRFRRAAKQGLQLVGQSRAVQTGQLAQPLAQAFLDLHGCLAREGQRDHALQGGLDQQQAHNAVDEHLGLARTGRGAQGDRARGVGRLTLDQGGLVGGPSTSVAAHDATPPPAAKTGSSTRQTPRQGQ